MKRHPVAKIIHNCQKRGERVPEFCNIGGTTNGLDGISWWVRGKSAWHHVLFLGKRQFVDGAEL